MIACVIHGAHDVRVEEVGPQPIGQMDAEVEIAIEGICAEPADLLHGVGWACGSRVQRTGLGSSSAWSRRHGCGPCLIAFRRMTSIVRDVAQVECQTGWRGGRKVVFPYVEAGHVLAARDRRRGIDQGGGGSGAAAPAVQLASQPSTVSCQSTEFSGFWTQWFSSGK